MPAKKKVVSKKNTYSKAKASSYSKKSPAKKSARPRAPRPYHEPTWSPWVGEAIGGTVGTMINPGFGTLIGGTMGRAAGNLFHNITGYGDYEIKDNLFLNGRLPEFANISTGGGTVIRFQEYLGDIITSPTAGAFNLTSYMINAAQENTFPFLSAIAAQYEQYEFEGLVFEFRSTSANALNSTNTALGSVMLCTEYNSGNPNFASKAQMLNHEFSNSVKPSESVMHMVECARQQNVLSSLYTNNGATPVGQDIRFYNLGNFQIATIGFQAPSVNIGELHVTYQVKLLKPQLAVALGELQDYAVVSSASYSNASPLGTSTIIINSSQTSVSNLSVTGNVITFDGSSVAKSFRIEFYWQGSLTLIASYPQITFTNANTGTNQIAPGAGQSATQAIMNRSFTTVPNSLPVQLTLDGTGVLPTTGSVSFRLIEIPLGYIA